MKATFLCLRTWCEGRGFEGSASVISHPPPPLPVFSAAPGLPMGLAPAQPETLLSPSPKNEPLAQGWERCSPPYLSYPFSSIARGCCQFLRCRGFPKLKLTWFSVLPCAGLESSSLGSAVHFAHSYLHSNFQYFYCCLFSYCPCPCGSCPFKSVLFVVIFMGWKVMKVNDCFTLPSLPRSPLHFFLSL